MPVVVCITTSGECGLEVESNDSGGIQRGASTLYCAISRSSSIPGNTSSILDSLNFDRGVGRGNRETSISEGFESMLNKYWSVSETFDHETSESSSSDMLLV